MTLEAGLEKRCVKMARDAGGEFLKLLPWVVRGLPDRLLLLPEGVVAFVELKAPEGRLTRLQAFWQDRLTRLGFVYRVVRGPDEFEGLLGELMPETDDPRSMGWVDDRGLP